MKHLTWEIKGEVPSMKNTLRISGGRVYHQSGEVDYYKESFAYQTPKKFKQAHEGPVRVSIEYWVKDRRRDVHNMEAVIFDALQYAGVIKNDRQILQWEGYLQGVDKKNPRVVIYVQLDTEKEEG